jgi:prefoldin subunit 5
MESAELRTVSTELADLRRQIEELRARVEHLETRKRDKHRLIPSAAQQPRSPAGGAGPRA